MAKKPKLTDIERSCRQREQAIERMRECKESIMEAAKEKCDAIEKRIARSRVILEAIRSGALKV